MNEITRVTEEPSEYHDLEKMSVLELLHNINTEDQKVPLAVQKVIPEVEKLVLAITDKMLAGGRLFYIGAGTSGRLGVLDASEIPPTYGMPHGLVIGLIAGGETAIRKAIENAEDDRGQGWKDLEKHSVSENDVVIGIAASGSTPYVLGALEECRKRNIITGSISCNPSSLISRYADYPVEVVVGPEFVTGSTRMKSGTAQKLLLNMISTSVMIQIGRVEGSKMVHMQLTNEKIVERGTQMVMSKLNLTSYEQARQLLLQHGSVKKATDAFQNDDNEPGEKAVI